MYMYMYFLMTFSKIMCFAAVLLYVYYYSVFVYLQLSGGFNRELVKQELVVELLERSRKIRRLFLFHDVLVSAKEKSPRYCHNDYVFMYMYMYIYCYIDIYF